MGDRRKLIFVRVDLKQGYEQVDDIEVKRHRNVYRVIKRPRNLARPVHVVCDVEREDACPDVVHDGQCGECGNEDLHDPNDDEATEGKEEETSHVLESIGIGDSQKAH